MFPYLRLKLLCWCLLLPGMPAVAQPGYLPAAFIEHGIQLKSDRELVSNTLVLFNQQPGTQVFRLFDRTEGLRVFNLPDSVSIPPFGSVSIPVKFLPLSRSLQPAEDEWSVSFSGSRGDTLRASFKVVADPVRHVLMRADEAQPSGNGNGPVVLHLINKGNVEERVHLRLSPGRFRLRPATPVFVLPPFQDTVVHVLLEPDPLAVQYSAEAPLLFSLTDSSGLLASVSVAGPGDLSGNGRAWNLRARPDNFLLLQSGGIGTGYRYHEAVLSVNAWGSERGLVLLADVMEQVSDKRRIVRNSYLGYNGAHMAFRAGTINRFDLLPLSGQGAELMLGTEGNQAGLVYIHTPNTYLYNEGLVAPGSFRSLGATGRLRLKKGETSLHALQQWEDAGALRNTMMSARLGIGNMEQRRADGELAFSRTVGRSGEVHNGWTGTLQLHDRMGRWEAQAFALYASPRYSGLLQNTTQSQNSLTYFCTRSDAHSMTAYFNGLYAGRRYDYITRTESDYLLHHAQPGFSYQWRHPLGIVQLNNYYTGQRYRWLSGMDFTVQAARTGLSLQAGKGRWHANAYGDFSWWQGGSVAGQPRAVRAQATLGFDRIDLQILYQKGNFFVTDLPIAYLSGQLPEFLNIGPVARFSALKRRLEFQGGYHLQFDRRYDHPLHYVQASLLARVAPFADFRGEWYYYRNHTVRNSDLRVSLQFYFGKPSLSRARRMLLFEDLNQDGVWNREEPRLGHTDVRCNNKAYRSNADGFLRCREQGPLEISGNRQYAVLQESFHPGRHYTPVPLYRIGTVRALVTVILPKYRRDSLSATGVVLQFIAASGKVYQATVREEGRLEVYLPEGSYRLAVAPLAAEQFALTQGQSIQVKAGMEQGYKVELVYRLARETEVKRFGNSLSAKN